jgi:deoxycytidylate deaminase
VTPSRHEKLMQIAFSAKLNSGCLSRQVGAVVTNKQKAIKSIGWNSSPDEQVPCLLRNIDMLLSNKDQEAYSCYERSDIRFRKVAEDYKQSLPDGNIIDGLNTSYCFKDLQNKRDGKDNQVHNRALHAEENAFLQLAKYGNEGANGGILYTTASPCDLCARKAYQIGIETIVYIDPYPGIAIDHVIKSGARDIELILFSGAIGRAYHHLYSPIIQIKDELEALIQ